MTSPYSKRRSISETVVKTITFEDFLSVPTDPKTYKTGKRKKTPAASLIDIDLQNKVNNTNGKIKCVCCTIL